MISQAATFTNDLKNFLESSNVPTDKISEHFGKLVWMIENKDNNENVIGLICYSFMYSTWAAGYAPFIIFCKGENVDQMKEFLSQKFPSSIIRGVLKSSDDQSM